MSKSILDSHATLAVNIPMSVRREEYLDHVTFQANIRPLFTETFGPLLGVKEAWHAQGATPGELDLSAFRYRAPKWGHLPINTGWLGGEETILQETDEHIIGRDAYGRTVKLIKSSATLPLPLDHPVKTMDDWLRIKHHYAFSEQRFGENWEEASAAHREAGRVVSVGIPGGFDEPRQLMGEEALCLAYYEQPDLVQDMLDTIGEMAFRVLDVVSSRTLIDQLDVHEDFAGKSGPLIGPKLVNAYLNPYYRKVWDLLASRGARVFCIDTDGNADAVTSNLVEAGINLMWPMEPAAGMDMVRTREQFGSRLAFMGGIDKHVLRRSKAEIVAELEYKLPPMIRTGGCLLGLDHRIPNGTPLEHYRFYIEKVWEIMEG